MNEGGRSQQAGKDSGKGAEKTMLFERPDLGGPTPSPW